MRIKKYVENLMLRAFLHWKSLGFLAYIPVLVINVLFPLISYAVYHRYGVGERLKMCIQEYGQILLPLTSVWWVMFAMHDYIEGEGCEVLYTSKVSTRFLDAIFLFVVSILNIMALFSVYALLIPSIQYEFIRITTICVLYFGLMYAFSYLTHSSAVTVSIIVMYTVFNIYYGCFQAGEKYSVFIYYSTSEVTKNSLCKDCLPLLTIGVFLTTIGLILNRKNKWQPFNG